MPAFDDRQLVSRRAVLASVAGTPGAAAAVSIANAETVALRSAPALPPGWTGAESLPLWLGAPPSRELIACRSPAQHVTDTTPPIFLTHAVDDREVQMQNSIIMLEAMQVARRPVEAHFLPKGGHGFGLGSRGAPCSEWPSLFTTWLGRHFTNAS